MNTSSTWKPNGFWQLGNECNLGISATEYFNTDTVGLGYQCSGGPTLQNQILADIGTEQFYLGTFAVKPKRTNYTGVVEQGQASYITNLQQLNLVPSVSFGYTAGAPYRLKKVLGSLTLGGYDQSRFTLNNSSFSFAPDNDRDIVVGIQSIVSKDQDGITSDLLATGVNAYIDSTVPQIWLPLEACKAFEKAFELVCDAENEIYPVSSTLHKKLVAQNASITFTFGNANSGGQTIDISLPYSSFDLQAQPPFTANATNYFALQRAVNETQYTLGRTFLQEAYLTVDWERSNYSISQCLFDPDVTQEIIVSIKFVNATSTSQHQGNSSAGRTIGIGVGVAVAVVVLAVWIAAFVILRRRKGRRQTEKATTKAEDDEVERIRQGFAKAELDTNLEQARYEMGDHSNEFGTKGHKSWVDEKARHPGLHAGLMGDGSRAELTGSGDGASELSNREKLRGPYHEIFDPSISVVEMPADMPRELPASPLPTFSRSSNLSQSFRSDNMAPVNQLKGASPLRQSSECQYQTNHRSARSPQPSASRAQSSQSQSSTSSPSAQASRGPSSPDLSGPWSPREQEPFSPISPIGGSEDGIDCQGFFSLVGGLTEPRAPKRPPRTSSTRQGRRQASSRTRRY